MSTTTAAVQPTAPLHKRVVVAYKKHERKILIATTVISTSAALTMRSGIAQHNAFLKEHGLFEQFYDIATTVES